MSRKTFEITGLPRHGQFSEAELPSENQSPISRLFTPGSGVPEFIQRLVHGHIDRGTSKYCVQIKPLDVVESLLRGNTLVAGLPDLLRVRGAQLQRPDLEYDLANGPSEPIVAGLVVV